jgi:hypothetical protein
MNSDYRIEKDRQLVVLTTVGGSRIVGEMFVQAYARHRMGPEEPRDVINGDEPFFPLLLQDGSTLLIAKEHVMELEMEHDPVTDPENEMLARAANVELTLSGGATRSGAVFLEVPFDRPRLLDFMNRFTDRFISLHTEQGVSLVNRRLVELVRPLD